jgi:hypothetical protein
MQLAAIVCVEELGVGSRWVVWQDPLVGMSDPRLAVAKIGESEDPMPSPPSSPPGADPGAVCVVVHSADATVYSTTKSSNS